MSVKPGELHGQPMGVLEDRLSRGDRACIRVQGGELIAYVWFSLGTYEDVGLRFSLAAGELWVHDAKVAPRHRARGHFPLLLQAAFSDLAGEGNTRALVAMDDLNRNFLRAFEQSGVRPNALSRFLVLRLGRLSVVRARRGRDTRWRRFTRRLDVAQELYGPGTTPK